MSVSCNQEFLNELVDIINKSYGFLITSNVAGQSPHHSAFRNKLVNQLEYY